jgi:hypothetical protein
VKDLQDENGNFFRVAGDLAFMIPMFEIAGKKHSKFLDSLNYCYNDVNPLCNHFLRRDEQIKNDLIIRHQKKQYLPAIHL